MKDRMGYIPEWIGTEEDYLREIAVMAEQIGYGNVIAHLQREWMIKLLEGNSLQTEESAREAVIGREPYPLDFHRPSGLRPIPKRCRK